MTLSAERKKQIEDEERTKFGREQETKEEKEYRLKVRQSLERGSLVSQGLKFAKKALEGL